MILFKKLQRSAELWFAAQRAGCDNRHCQVFTGGNRKCRRFL